MLPTRALFARSVWKGTCVSVHLRPIQHLLTLCPRQALISSRKFTGTKNPHLRALSASRSCHSSPDPPVPHPYLAIGTIPRTHPAVNTHSLPIAKPKAGERIPPIKTQARSAVILPNFVGFRFMIHNGKNYNEITITEDMVGYKLGEFSP